MLMDKAIVRLGDRVAKVLTAKYDQQNETDFHIDVSRTRPEIVQRFVDLSFGNYWDPPTRQTGYRFNYDTTTRQINVIYDPVETL